MNKVISFELKKMVSRPGVYVLALILSLMLVASVFLYKPKTTTYSNYTMDGESVVEIYNNFTSTSGLQTINKSYLDELIENTKSKANTYDSTNSNYNLSNSKENFDNIFKDMDTSINAFINANSSPSGMSSETATLLLNDINAKISALSNAFENNDNKNELYFVSTKTNYNTLKSNIMKLQNLFLSGTDYDFMATQYVKTYKSSIQNGLNSLTFPSYDTAVKLYENNGEYYTITIYHLEQITAQMDNLYNSALSNDDFSKATVNVNKIQNLYNAYVQYANLYSNLFKAHLNSVAQNSVAKSVRDDLRNVSNFYTNEDTLAILKYYIENNKFENNFAKQLSMTSASGEKINTFDYTYFVISIFSIILIIFGIYMGAYAISGEISSGTMRMLATRPVSRNKIYAGKYLAISIMTLIITLFSTIISLIVGGFVFSFSANNVLVVLNNAKVLSLHPILLILALNVSIILKVMLFTSISMLLSTAIKSDLLSMIITTLIYLSGMILPLFFSTNSWIKFYPFCNINIYAYLGGATINNGSILSTLFDALVYSGNNIFITLAYIFGGILLYNILGKVLFKKREL